MNSWLKQKAKISRDSILFLVGIIGIIHEVFLTSLDRPDVLILFLALVGLPAFLRGDEKTNGNSNNGNDSGNQNKKPGPNDDSG